MAVKSGLYASLASAFPIPSAGDLYLPTDSFYNALYYNGSAWDYLKHGKKLVPPTGYSWVSGTQGSASLSTAGGAETIIAPSNAGAHSCRMRVRTAPSTPWKVTMAFMPTLTGANYNYAGPYFRESSSGKFHAWLFCFDSGAPDHLLNIWNSPTAPSTNYFRISLGTLISTPLVFWRIGDDGSLRSYEISGDGVDFVTVWTESNTLNFTADEYGHLANPYSQPLSYSLIHSVES